VIGDTIEIAVQVNGRLRGSVQVPVDAAQDVVEAAALAEEKVQSHISGKTVVKKIYVPGRLVNIVVKG
jgi:leucyl-tRNA synthetase